mmetsp:Transcript_20531/g.28295  ORF Transcript_20531/g.28295 Transcript_20531/m.28295 type:complete len:194 (-) Transcript_20531:176-757(-)|eukprot:CAMPEP_0170058498 /NCGR_PEP_ID=MMETSP0019_2-20121128/1103_1 /TAXON_ID=98059 /ORGANISM="Dinobryon sp., Strain UTEXLB2267" /LENGTH=193 /DNA_ID=CAMNT_0010263463 /DNA_START=44 /DNA_END=625 /DNA_ORIENTATION=-
MSAFDDFDQPTLRVKQESDEPILRVVKKEIRLVSQDGESFVTTEEIAQMSELVKTMIVDGVEGDDEDREIPLPNVHGEILAKVVEFCTHYTKVEAMTELEKPLKDSDLTKLVQDYYSSFILSLDHDAVFHLTLAANYMDIRPLLDLCCAKIASLIKGKTPEEIRNNLNIVNDFSPEEEAKVREENRWADDLSC